MIKLFSTTDTTYLTNGDKIIIPTRAYVFKEDNGSFYLELECSLDYVEDLTPNRILVANTPQGDQAFRITNVTKTRKKISLKAKHISYDANNYLIKDTFVVNKTGNQAMQQLNNATDNPSPFNVGSDISNTNSYRCVRKTLYEAWQVVVERWGGHLVRDNWNVSVNASIGADNGVVVRYAKNLKEISVDYNWDAVVTKLLPVGQDGLLLPETYLTSSIQYDIPYTKSVNFDQSEIDPEDYETEAEYNQALIDDLRSQGQAYVDANSIPKVSYTLSANLERISDVGDTIEVIDEKLGINLTTHLLSYTYDCLLDKYIELTFGNFTNQLSNLLSGISSSTTQLVNEVNSETVSMLEGELATATQNIMAVLGNSYVIMDGNQILIVDRLPKETATNVIRINSAGIGFSQNGISGTFNSAWQINGTMDMQKFTVSNLVADMISGGDLGLTANNITISSEHFNVDANGNLECSNAQISGEITASSGAIGGYEITKSPSGTNYIAAQAYPKYNFDISDYLKVKNYLDGTGTLTPMEELEYDIDGDGQVTATDMQFIYRMIELHIDTGQGIHVQLTSNPNDLNMNGFSVIAGYMTVFGASPMWGVTINNGRAYGQRVLFEDISLNGDNGTITLDDQIDTDLGLTFDITSYKYIEIFGRDNNGQAGAYVKLEGVITNGHTFMLSEIEAGTGTYIRRTKYTVTNDNQLVPSNGGYVYITSNGAVQTNSSQNYIYIRKVVGWK